MLMLLLDSPDCTVGHFFSMWRPSLHWRKVRSFSSTGAGESLSFVPSDCPMYVIVPFGWHSTQSLSYFLFWIEYSNPRTSFLAHPSVSWLEKIGLCTGWICADLVFWKGREEALVEHSDKDCPRATHCECFSLLHFQLSLGLQIQTWIWGYS